MDVVDERRVTKHYSAKLGGRPGQLSYTEIAQPRKLLALWTPFEPLLLPSHIPDIPSLTSNLPLRPSLGYLHYGQSWRFQCVEVSWLLSSFAETLLIIDISSSQPNLRLTSMSFPGLLNDTDKLILHSHCRRWTIQA